MCGSNRSIRLSIGGWLLLAAGSAASQTPAEPVWADEFDGPSINTANWTLEIGTGTQYGLVGWGNNELQYYTQLSDNAYVADGKLHIVARQASVDGMNYTSARLMSRGKVFGLHGRIEARIRIPGGKGIWPAFWMLRENGIWPGEIDIMEIIGSAPHRLHATSHQGVLPNLFSLGSHLDAPSGVDWTQDFHVYGIEWWPGSVVWTIDGEPYYEVTKADVLPNHAWLFEEDMYLLLNLAVGGNWPGAPDASTVFPVQMEVDYVRWYDLPSTAQPVTFRLNASTLGLSASDLVHLNGSFNGWCGSCTPMVHNGSGIWSKVLWLAPGVHEYKFTVNGWAGQADAMSPGDFCTLTTYGAGTTYVNRYVTVQDEPLSLSPVCLNSCLTCAGSVPSTLRQHTFRMHHPTESGGAAAVVISGVGVFPMQAGSTGTYSTTVLVPAGSAYSYTLNGAPEVLASGCASRTVPVSGVFAPFADCFAQCVGCGTCSDAGFIGYNPLATFTGGCSEDPILPGCTISAAINYLSTASWEDGSCVFESFAVCPADWDHSGAVNVADLLILLGAFGSECID